MLLLTPDVLCGPRENQYYLFVHSLRAFLLNPLPVAGYTAMHKTEKTASFPKLADQWRSRQRTG